MQQPRATRRQVLRPAVRSACRAADATAAVLDERRPRRTDPGEGASTLAVHLMMPPARLPT